jgi:hypothetical protein
MSTDDGKIIVPKRLWPLVIYEIRFSHFLMPSAAALSVYVSFNTLSACQENEVM